MWVLSRLERWVARFGWLLAGAWCLWMSGVYIAPAAQATGAAFPNVMVNGGFEDDQDGDGKPDGWTVSGTTELIENGGAAGMWGFQLTGTETNPFAKGQQTISIVEPTPLIVTVACLVKGTDIQSFGGGEGVAKFKVSFFAEDGVTLLAKKTLKRKGGTFDWRRWIGYLRIPEGAKTVEVKVQLGGATGEVVFDEVELLWDLPDDYDLENLVVDGGFEYYRGSVSPWRFWNAPKVIYPGFNSYGALTISLTEPRELLASQPLVIDDAAAILDATMELYLKLEDVVATEPEGGAKVRIRFWDGQRRDLEPTLVLGPWTGTTATWELQSSTVTIPPEAQVAALDLMLEGATGTASFDEMRLTANSAQGPVLRPVESVTDTTNWQAFTPIEGPLVSPVDVSDLLDPPAGAHGFLTVQNGDFIFEDGTPIRFFGMTIQGEETFPTHADAELLAERFAQLGWNIIRFHRLDKPFGDPNIFDPAFDDTQHLSADSLDRLSYFIAQLKARGIYVHLDLLDSRRFKAGDGVAAYGALLPGAKIVAEYNPRIIELQQLYAADLLTHLNPYTGLRLVDDPALALVGLINESSIFQLPKFGGALPQVYRDEVQQLWVDYLTAQGVPNPEGEADRFLDGNDPEVQQFYVALQTGYFQQMHAYLRGIGLQIPMAGSNKTLEGLDLQTNASLDFIDRHAYWDHPKGFGDFAQFNNNSLIEVIEGHNLLAKLSRNRVSEMPYVVSEWNIPWPNEYRAAGPMLMAAYGLFQGWDGLIQFDFRGELMPMLIEKNFDVSTMPEQFLQMAAAARLFHRGDVLPALVRHAYLLLPEPSIPPALGFLHGIERILDGVETSPDEVGVAPWISDTGELSLDDVSGIVLIDTPRTQAAVGRVGEIPDVPIALRDVTFSMTTPFAGVILTSLDGQPLETSEHLLLITVARSENTNTIYNASRTLLRDSGVAPILLEPVEGSAQLPLGGRPVPDVFVLDAAGHQVAVVPVTVVDQVVELPLGQGASYELVFGEGGNSPPVLDPIGNQTVDEGTILAFAVTASDPDVGDVLSLSASNLPPGASFADNGGGVGTFSWTPDGTHVGIYPGVHFEVTDGSLTASEDITITVNAVGGPTNSPPSLDVDEGELVTFLVTATDPDPEDVLTLTAQDLPSGATFTDHGDRTGTFTWTPGFDQAGLYRVIFEVRDGQATDSATARIWVKNVSE